MILANLQERLTPADVSFAVHVLAEGNEDRRRHLEREIGEQGFDRLLDDPELFPRLRTTPGVGSPSAALFLCVAVRETLRRAGLRDAQLSNYVGALLYEFGFLDRAFRISEHDEHVYRYVADIVADIDHETGRRRFLLQAHLGNFTLWMAGVFPDHITSRKHRRGGPDLEYYEEMGMRGFREAAHHRLAEQLNLAEIYAQAADSFSSLRVALNRLSDRLLFPNVSSPDRLMRQVRDEFRLGI